MHVKWSWVCSNCDKPRFPLKNIIAIYYPPLDTHNAIDAQIYNRKKGLFQSPCSNQTLTDQYEVDLGLSGPISRQLTCPSLRYPAQDHSDPLETDNLKPLITGQLFDSHLDKINQTSIRHLKSTFFQRRKAKITP